MAVSPRVSVIIATYNWSSVLRYAIQSVLWQEFQDFELIVVGDGCTDDSQEVVASFADARIRWHNLERNCGSQWLPNNTGIAMARGTYIAYLGHDDLWLPDHLRRLVHAAEQADAAVAYALAEMIGPPATGFRILTGLSVSGGYEQELYFPPSSMMHTRACALEIGGWADARTIDIPTDNDFIFRLSAAGKRFVPTNALSVLKFPASWRFNAYRERQSGEQEEYARRIQAEPDFVQRELLAILSSYIWGRSISIPIPAQTANLPRDWWIEHTRYLRGLGEHETSHASAGEALDMREQQLVGYDFRWFSGMSAFIAEEGTPVVPALSALETGRVTPVGTYQGCHDETPSHLVGGWARDSARPDTPLIIEVYEGEQRLGTVMANLLRQDLIDAGLGDGRAGFKFPAPEALRDGQAHAITLRIAGTGIALDGTPRMIRFSADPAPH